MKNTNLSLHFPDWLLFIVDQSVDYFLHQQISSVNHRMSETGVSLSPYVLFCPQPLRH